MPLPLLLACAPGEIALTGTDAFGPVGSAFVEYGVAAEHYTLDYGGALVSWGRLTLPAYLLVADTEDGCEEHQRMLSAWSDASVELLRADAPCEAIPALLEALEEMDAVAPNPGKLLQLRACDDDFCFAAGATYALPDDDVGGWLTYTADGYRDGGYARALAAWSTETCGYDEEASDLEHASTTAWTVVGGSVTVDRTTARFVDGSFSLVLEGDGEVTATGEFHAEDCPAPPLEATVTPGWVTGWL